MPHHKPHVRLWAAAQNQDHAGLLAALRAGASVHALNDQGWTALMWASQAYGEAAVAMVAALLAAGADPNQPGQACSSLSLVVGASRPLLPVLDALLDAGADPNARDERGNRPLVLLLQRHRETDGTSEWTQETVTAGIACARRLIRHGAVLTELNAAGEDARTIAERHQYADRNWLTAWAVRREQQALHRSLHEAAPLLPAETPNDWATAGPRSRL